MIYLIRIDTCADAVQDSVLNFEIIGLHISSGNWGRELLFNVCTLRQTKACVQVIHMYMHIYVCMYMYTLEKLMISQQFYTLHY